MTESEIEARRLLAWGAKAQGNGRSLAAELTDGKVGLTLGGKGEAITIKLTSTDAVMLATELVRLARMAP